MKKLLLSTVLLFFVALPCIKAQIIAGDIPANMISTSSNFSMSLASVTGASISDSLDLDDDGNEDIIFVLFKGATSIDMPNSLQIRKINTSYDFCNYTGAGGWGATMQLYSLGDTMACAGSSDWEDDDICLGNYGCFGCVDNPMSNNKFIAYRKDSTEYGWIKLSHNLQDGGSQSTAITLVVHEFTTAQLPSAIAETAAHKSPDIATIDFNTLALIGLNEIVPYQIISIDGRIVESGKTSATIDISALSTGVWILKIGGFTAPIKFIKQ